MMVVSFLWMVVLVKKFPTLAGVCSGPGRKILTPDDSKLFALPLRRFLRAGAAGLTQKQQNLHTRIHIIITWSITY